MKYLAIALLFVASVTNAQQPPKEVIVINDPLLVEVLSTTDPLLVEVINQTVSEQSRFQLVGFTTAIYDGNLGGVFGFTNKCQLEFPDSRWCTMNEVITTTSIPTGLTGKAWIGSEIITTRLNGCGQPAWTTNAPAFGCTNGKPHNNGHECALDKRVAPDNCLQRTQNTCVDGCCPPFFKVTGNHGDTVTAEGHFSKHSNTSLDQACFQFFPLACCALVP